MKGRIRGRTQPCDVAGIRRYFGLDERNVKHRKHLLTPKSHQQEGVLKVRLTLWETLVVLQSAFTLHYRPLSGVNQVLSRFNRTIVAAIFAGALAAAVSGQVTPQGTP